MACHRNVQDLTNDSPNLGVPCLLGKDSSLADISRPAFVCKKEMKR